MKVKYLNGIPTSKESNVSCYTDKTSIHQSTNESDYLQALIITNEKSILLLPRLGIG